MEFFNAFGINGKIIIAQVVNFAVLLLILNKIGYRPIKKFVEERTAKIEEGVKNAEEAKKALANAKEEQESILASARKEAAKIIETAQVKAKEQGDAQLAKAKQEVAHVVAQGKTTIESERQKMMEEVKSDVITLVVESTKQVLGNAVDEKVDQAWLKNQLAKVKK
jgi:F-type H+-transporting ATPase subunit b